MAQPRLRIVPIELADANAFIAQHHRHHAPVVGHRFSVGAVDEDDELRGVAVVGRPVARLINQRSTVEVTRLATDGCENACSALYGAAARIARELGFGTIQTYILDTESGTSLRASGWQDTGEAGGGPVEAYRWQATPHGPAHINEAPVHSIAPRLATVEDHLGF